MAENPGSVVQPTKGVSPITVVVVLIFVGVLVFGAYSYYERYGRLPLPDTRPSASQPHEPVGNPSSSPLDLLRSEQVIVDETVAVDAGGHQMRSFELPSDRKVRVVVEGVSHTAKGYSVYCIDPGEWDKLTSGKQFSYTIGLSGKKIQAFDKIERLAAGKHAIVISNTENMMNTMQVRVRIIADPK